MLKFEETAEIGDLIRAYDFEPIPGREDHYVTGTVIEKGPLYQFIPGREHAVYVCDGYTIDCTFDTDERRVGTAVMVPFEMSLTDFDERVENLTVKMFERYGEVA